MEQFFDEIRQKTEGTLLVDAVSRTVYSVDASIYELEPLAVFLPSSLKDLKDALVIAKKWSIPITPRGAATGITGACLGKGLIIDCSKSLNKILEIDVVEKFAIVEPGVVQDDLNHALASHKFRLGPDTSTGNRATIGGMLANNAAGSRSLKYGRMVDHIVEAELLLASGQTLHLKAMTKKEALEKSKLATDEGRIYKTVLTILDQKKEEILKRFPNIPRHVSGYGLDFLLEEAETFNLAKLIAGSEGTLGVVSKIKLNIVPDLLKTSLTVISFKDLEDLFRHIPSLLKFNPISLELIDDHILKAGIDTQEFPWYDPDQTKAILALELEAESYDELQLKEDELYHFLKKSGLNPSILKEAKIQKKLWEIRKSGLGLLLSKRDYSRSVAFLEDVSIDPNQLAGFMKEFLTLLKEHGKEAGVYGHAGSGCMHIRPYIDLRYEKERLLLKDLMEKTVPLLLKYNGTLSGEHGDGFIRSWLNPKIFGESLYEAFLEIKKAFDPDFLMNPGKIVDGPDPLDNIRKSPEDGKVATFLDFKEEGGFELSVDLCNGNGLCRKKEGVMCPSFQATNDERDTTRARAVTLRRLLRGDLGREGLASDELMEVLDLCLECKGCKTECPSHVDMAKMKSEVLYHRNQKKGVSLRDNLFGKIGDLSKFASLFPKTSNKLKSKPFIKEFLNKIGLTPYRPLPDFANTRFSKLAKKINTPSRDKTQIVLFNDTFNEFYCPEIGMSLLSLFDKMEVDVIIPSYSCCGRTLISKGLLEDALKKAKKLVETFYPYAEKGIPIVGMEPSCILTLKEDLVSLAGNKAPALIEPLKQIASVSMTLSEFLVKHLKSEPNLLKPLSLSKLDVFIHGHCHEKALLGMHPEIEVLSYFPFVQPKIIPSGCCGMAGSFGYEKEHFDLSMKIGNLVLLPYIEKLNEDAILLANGFSCRNQISFGTRKKALHLGEVLNILTS